MGFLCVSHHSGTIVLYHSVQCFENITLNTVSGFLVVPRPTANPVPIIYLTRSRSLVCYFKWPIFNNLETFSNKPQIWVPWKATWPHSGHFHIKQQAGAGWPSARFPSRSPTSTLRFHWYEIVLMTTRTPCFHSHSNITVSLGHKLDGLRV